jgi:hypothetical protein
MKPYWVPHLIHRDLAKKMVSQHHAYHLVVVVVVVVAADDVAAVAVGSIILNFLCKMKRRRFCCTKVDSLVEEFDLVGLILFLLLLHLHLHLLLMRINQPYF